MPQMLLFPRYIFVTFNLNQQVGQYIQEEEGEIAVVGSKPDQVEPRITEEKKTIKLPARKTHVQGVSN